MHCLGLSNGTVHFLVRPPRFDCQLSFAVLSIFMSDPPTLFWEIAMHLLIQCVPKTSPTGRTIQLSTWFRTSVIKSHCLKFLGYTLVFVRLGKGVSLFWPKGTHPCQGSQLTEPLQISYSNSLEVHVTSSQVLCNQFESKMETEKHRWKHNYGKNQAM